MHRERRSKERRAGTEVAARRRRCAFGRYDALAFDALKPYLDGRSQDDLKPGDEVDFPGGTCVITQITNRVDESREIGLEAVKQNGRAIRFASAGLKNDLDVVMHAVAQTPSALWNASRTLRDGGLKAHLANQMRDVFNVSQDTFVATILFGEVPRSFSMQIKQLIGAYAGVRSGQKWRLIAAAASHIRLDVPLPRDQG